MTKSRLTSNFAAKGLAVGTHHVVANYGGSADFALSTSAKETLTVVK